MAGKSSSTTTSSAVIVGMPPAALVVLLHRAIVIAILAPLSLGSVRGCRCRSWFSKPFILYNSAFSTPNAALTDHNLTYHYLLQLSYRRHRCSCR